MGLYTCMKPGRDLQYDTRNKKRAYVRDCDFHGDGD